MARRRVPGIDAEAHEADGEMDFTVRLEPHGLGIVTVDYATRDGSARAGSDYTETSGTLRFNSLEMERTVTVPITDDAHEDDGETFRLRLTNPTGATLRSGEREATGTIRNSDPEALSASFPASAFASSSHSGADDRPQAVVAFSEAVAAFGADTPSVSVTGGGVASVQPHAEDGLENAWVFFLAPDGDGDVTFALLAGTACASGGICTPGGTVLAEVPAPSTIPGPGGPAEPAGPPLTASFEDVPSEHDGESALTFRVAFSEDIGISYRSLREDAFTMTNGHITRGRRVDDRRDLFEMTVQPDSRDAITILLEAGRDCAVSGAICTKGDNRRPLTNSPTATVEGRPANTPATGAPAVGGTPRVGDELTASTLGISDADGLADASFAYQWMRGGADIPGATGPAYTAAAADEGERLKVRVSFTDDAGHAESLTSAPTDAVAARSAPLTASFEGTPSEHRGEGGFHFRVAFSEDIGISYRSLREDAFTVTGGRVTSGKRVDGRRDLFRMTVRPDSDGDVTITLPAGRECGVSGAICTKGENRRQLTNSPSATVRGPVGISVADARVEEGDGALLAFVVTLSRAAGGTVTVDYATSDGSAQAGVDYRAASGTLTFRAGKSSKTVEVAALDDSHDEGEETLTLRLSNASGARVTDAEATGTIENTDPMPAALLARFGRATAEQVVTHIEERMAAPRQRGFRARLAGRELRPGSERDFALGFLSQFAQPTGAAGAVPMGGAAMGGAAMGGTGSMTMARTRAAPAPSARARPAWAAARWARPGWAAWAAARRA